MTRAKPLVRKRPRKRALRGHEPWEPSAANPKGRLSLAASTHPLPGGSGKVTKAAPAGQEKELPGDMDYRLSSFTWSPRDRAQAAFCPKTRGITLGRKNNFSQ